MPADLLDLFGAFVFEVDFEVNWVVRGKFECSHVSVLFVESQEKIVSLDVLIHFLAELFLVQRAQCGSQFI